MEIGLGHHIVNELIKEDAGPTWFFFLKLNQCADLLRFSDWNL
jgi:hypothetical protein